MCLPLGDDSFEQHIKRADFLACIQHHPDLRRHPFPWLGFGEWILQASAPHKTCPSKFISSSPIYQDQYNSEANSEDESEAV